jgi:hypothetical protein
VDKTLGTIYCFKNDELEDTWTGFSDYIGSNTVLKTVKDTTYVLNKDKAPYMSTDTESDYRKVSYINVTSALNYGETVSVGVGSIADSPATQVHFQVPDLGATPDYDTADKARATANVASELAAALNAEAWFNTTKTAYSLGSSVAIYLNDNSDFVDIYVMTGQGDRSTVAINRTIENVDGLPLYAIDGSIVQIKPNPLSEKGIYYLKAARTVENEADPDYYMEEVVWAETRAPTEPYALDNTNMPHRIQWDDTQFVYDAESWKERRTGDDNSAKVPKFIGKKIDDIGHFQNRLVFIADGEVFMTETDDLLNWWRASAVTLLVTDPIHISSNAVDTNNIQFISNHNKDLFFTAENGQYKITGEQAITPQTVSMPKVASFECVTTVSPIEMGDSVLIPMSHGASAGLLEYDTRKNTEQDTGDSMTRHVVNYMKGTHTHLVGSVNSNIVAMTTDNIDNSNKVFIFEYTIHNTKKVQKSWSIWEFPETVHIIGLEFKDDTLTVISKESESIVIQTVRLYDRVTTDTDEVFLDYMTTVASDGFAITIPDGYIIAEDTMLVSGLNTSYPLWEVPYTQQGNQLIFEEGISNGQACEVYIGKPWSSWYTLTRPYRRDEEGIPITTDRIRISRWTINVVDTHELILRTLAKYAPVADQKFTGKVMGNILTTVGERNALTGDLKFSYSQEAEHSETQLRTDGFLGMTIAGISWSGQYHKTSGRI